MSCLRDRPAARPCPFITEHRRVILARQVAPFTSCPRPMWQRQAFLSAARPQDASGLARTPIPTLRLLSSESSRVKSALSQSLHQHVPAHHKVLVASTATLLLLLASGVFVSATVPQVGLSVTNP
ncbi:hypothetical protein MN608_03984 [Microdochium nivale]|nr:hypothetical protein MN608_03984 [Microdochium nivale]